MEWALRFVWDDPRVSLLLSGMSAMDQVIANVEIASRGEAGSLTSADVAQIGKVRDAYKARTVVDCTGCRYCVPCPQGIDIPQILAGVNNASLFDDPEEERRGYGIGVELGHTARASECVRVWSVRGCLSAAPRGDQRVGERRSDVRLGRGDRPMQDAGRAQRLQGRVALVTGAGGTNSIGRSVALRLAAEGAAVGALDVSGERAALVVDEILGAGGVAMPLTCDITRPEQCEAAAAALVAAHDGRIDILVNNAAAFAAPGSVHTHASFLDWSADEWDHILDVNVRGMWFMVRAVFPYMERNAYGKVVNVTSSTFWEAPPGLVPYISSKGAVIGFTRALARELGPAGIRVNALAPGFTLTQSNLEQGEDILKFADTIRRERCLSARDQVADDLAGPAFFLASTDSDFMTGQTLLVDGGLNFN